MQAKQRDEHRAVTQAGLPLLSAGKEQGWGGQEGWVVKLPAPSAELQRSTVSPSVLCTSVTEIKMNCHVSFKRKIPQPLSIQAVTFPFMLSVYSVLALWFMINLKELDHTFSRSSRRNFC